MGQTCGLCPVCLSSAPISLAASEAFGDRGSDELAFSSPLHSLVVQLRTKRLTSLALGLGVHMCDLEVSMSKSWGVDEE